MSTHKRKISLRNVAVKLGCSNCMRPKISSIFHPKPRHHHKTTNNNNNIPSIFPQVESEDRGTHPRFVAKKKKKKKKCFQNKSHKTTNNYSNNHDSSSSSSNTTTTTTTFQGFGRIGGESVAVEKDSDDPYVDFRQSMLQMILAKEIYSKEELRELLNCFLQLNSPYYHGIIVRAFTEIWHCVFAVKPGVAGAESPFLQCGSSGGGGEWWSRV
ncbi:transcription repressor OFP6-like [Lycium ferocissimum]|uniref:transcription repressor OFP6-like n=1 Tax=Lycium ferocissimum TaxID=112874 RepID=UPI0028163FDE|nr:transcription repressor OFP6-like [Lycium ferocissimum]